MGDGGRHHILHALEVAAQHRGDSDHDDDRGHDEKRIVHPAIRQNAGCNPWREHETGGREDDARTDGQLHGDGYNASHAGMIPDRVRLGDQLRYGERNAASNQRNDDEQEGVAELVDSYPSAPMMRGRVTRGMNPSMRFTMPAANNISVPCMNDCFFTFRSSLFPCRLVLI